MAPDTAQAPADVAWKSVWPRVAKAGVPVIAGGRSAGSQVACRTAKDLGAMAVVALAYPLLGPGSRRELLATGLPTLTVQGTDDPFGQPAQFPSLPPPFEMIEVPSATTCSESRRKPEGRQGAEDRG